MFQRELRDMSFTPRWTIVRTVKGQNLAEHSYFVAVYAMQIADFLQWKGDKGKLLSYALLHDIEETFTGDIPGPVKRRMGTSESYDEWVDGMILKRFGKKTLNDRYEYTIEMSGIVKLANLVDEIAFLCTEIALGNKSIPTSVFENTRARVDKAIDFLWKNGDSLQNDLLVKLRQKIAEMEAGHVQVMTMLVPTDQ